MKKFIIFLIGLFFCIYLLLFSITKMQFFVAFSICAIIIIGILFIPKFKNKFQDFLYLIHMSISYFHMKPYCLIKNSEGYIRNRDIFDKILPVYWSNKQKTLCKYTARFIKWKNIQESIGLYTCSDGEIRSLHIKRIVIK